MDEAAPILSLSTKPSNYHYRRRVMCLGELYYLNESMV